MKFKYAKLYKPQSYGLVLNAAVALCLLPMSGVMAQQSSLITSGKVVALKEVALGHVKQTDQQADNQADKQTEVKAIRKVDTDKADLIAPNIVPEALWDGRGKVPFHAVDYPKMVAATAADFLDDGEYILGLTVNGQSRAYPTRFIWRHHFINDKTDKTGPDYPEFTLAYCSVCNTGIRFDPRVNGKRVLFDFYGLYNGVVTMCDRDTQSVWLSVEGRAVKGARTGSQLQMASLLDTTWGEWRKRHPDTLVMSQENEYQRFYGDKTKVEPRGYDRFPMAVFEQTLTQHDKRLPMFDKVLAVTLAPDIIPPVAVTPTQAILPAKLHRAYPIATLKEAKGVLNDTLGTLPVVAMLTLETQTANAFSRLVDGKTLTFEARAEEGGKPLIYDKETGTRWNIEGVGEAGPLIGKTLTRIDNHLSQWYGWVAYFPNTSIYGRTDMPQTEKVIFPKLAPPESTTPIPNAKP